MDLGGLENDLYPVGNNALLFWGMAVWCLGALFRFVLYSKLVAFTISDDVAVEMRCHDLRYS